MTVSSSQIQSKKRLTPVLLGITLAVLGAVAVIVNLKYARDPARARIQRGIALMQANRPQDAVKEWEEAINLDPKRVEPYQLLAGAYLEASRPDLVIPLLENLRVLDPKSPHTLCQLAEAYAQSGEEKKTLEVARQAVTLEPNCARSHAILGIALGNQLETKSSIEALTKAHQLAPNDDKIAMSLAQVLLDSSDQTGAERLARLVIARNPNYPTAYYTLGRSYSRRTPTPENLREGIKAFEKATQLKPEWGDAFAELGRMRLALGDAKGAIEALEYIWKRNVRTEEAAYNLAAAYRKVGQIARAEQLTKEFKRLSDFATRYQALKKKIVVNPNDLETATLLAEMETEQKNYSDAQMLIGGVLRAKPQDVRALKVAIKLYEVQGQMQMAAGYRQRLASLPKEGNKPTP
jgi:tetratricopeptide (TPR) repeat protein